MNVSNFNAEYSIYKPNNHYRSSGTDQGSNLFNSVRPSLQILLDGNPLDWYGFTSIGGDGGIQIETNTEIQCIKRCLERLKQSQDQDGGTFNLQQCLDGCKANS
jgi:hypothetical protein